MDIAHPYLLFLGDAKDALAAKTAQGIVDWRADWCLGQLRLPDCQADLGLPDMTAEHAVAAGAKTLVIGVVNAGGVLPETWQNAIVGAIEAGLDVASGLHRPLAETEVIGAAAKTHGRQLYDVRLSARAFPTGTGRRRSGKRVLTVGTDCSVGKKYAALALERELISRNLNADFRATGQTGVLIAGSGIAIDAVVADFIAGAAEWLSPDNEADHWDVIEGQGSLFHPAYAGVSLGLLHGSQPDALVLCHEPTRTHMRNVDHPIPDVMACIDANLKAAQLNNAKVQCVGLSVNTSALGEVEATAILQELADESGLPATDPVRFGVAPIVDRMLKQFP